jgi:hypothetical protein
VHEEDLGVTIIIIYVFILYSKGDTESSWRVQIEKRSFSKEFVSCTLHKIPPVVGTDQCTSPDHSWRRGRGDLVCSRYCPSSELWRGEVYIGNK